MIFPPEFPQPPARFVQANQTAVMRFMPADAVTPWCSLYATKGGVAACKTELADGRCLVIMPAPSSWEGTPKAYMELLQHELGHCAGWTKDHEK